MAAKTIWTLSSGLDGCEIQMAGIAAGLAQRTGAQVITKQVRPPAWRRLLAPYGSPAPQADMAPPWPDILIAAGRQTIPYARYIGKRAGGRTFTVILQNPRRDPALFDFVWAPVHDGLAGDNVISTLTAPHNLTHAGLTEAAAHLKPRLADASPALPRPWIAVLLGGPNKAYKFTAADIKRLADGLCRLAANGAGLMISASRRTPPAMLAQIKQALMDGDGEGRAVFFSPALNGERKADYNLYHGILGLAEAIIITADSVNMVSEACFVGVPMEIFYPHGGSRRFDHFHKTLQAQGLTRPFTGDMESLRATPAAKPPPVNSTDEIVETIYKQLI